MATRDGTATGKRTRGNAAGGRAEGGGGYLPKNLKAAEREQARGMELLGKAQEWNGKAQACFAKAATLMTPTTAGAPPGA